MNKQIESLALQAGMRKTSLHYGRKDPYVLWEDDIDRFAELIIEECISACSTSSLGKTTSAEDLIRTHFKN